MTFRLAGLFSLDGRSALVTGGNSGIGLAMARALALAGARVTLVARRETELAAAAAELSAEGAEADCIATDLAAPDAAAFIGQQLAERGRTIDILVNAAGVNLRQPFGEVTAAAFDLHSPR